MFAAFEQVDNTATRSFGGTGLGLAVSRQLTTLMGCTLTVTSREGHGTCFEITLPLIPQAAEVQGRRTSPLARRAGLAACLRHLGCEVLTDSDPATLLAARRDAPPALILLDGSLAKSALPPAGDRRS